MLVLPARLPRSHPISPDLPQVPDECLITLDDLAASVDLVIALGGDGTAEANAGRNGGNGVAVGLGNLCSFSFSTKST